MVVAEMRAAHMPVEVLGLYVERESIGQQRVERAGHVLGGVRAEIGRRSKAGLSTTPEAFAVFMGIILVSPEGVPYNIMPL